MKRLLIVTILTFSCFALRAQLATRVTAQWASWDAQITAASPASPFMPLQDKVLRDSIYQFIIDAAALVASTGNLQAVTALGNTTNLSIICTTPGFSAIMNAAGFEEFNTATSFPETFIGHYAGSPVMWLSNGTHFANVKAATLTGDRTYLLPDEGAGSYPNDVIGLHRSNLPYTVYLGSSSSVLDYNNVLISDGVGNAGQFTATGFSVHDMTGNAFSALLSSGLPTLNFLNSGTSKISQIGFVPPTDNRQQYFPDEGSSSNIPGSTLVTHTTKDVIRVYSGIDSAIVDPITGHGFSIKSGATNVAQLYNSTGAGRVSLLDRGSIYHASIEPDLLTGSRTYKLPDENGTLATLSDTVGGSGIGRLLTPTSQSNSVVFRDRKTAQTASVNLATYTVGGSDESLEVSANVLVTTATLHNFNVTCTYTDEGGTSRTLTMPFSSLAGAVITAIANAGGTVPSEGVPLHIRAKSGTTVIIGSTGTFTTVTYNIEGVIKKY